jgi:hypothetical protein
MGLGSTDGARIRFTRENGSKEICAVRGSWWIIRSDFSRLIFIYSKSFLIL